MYISDHAVDRAKKRMGLGKKSLWKMVSRAYNEGVSYTDTYGKFKKYLDIVIRDNIDATTVKVYGTHLFLFRDDCLVTIMFVPKEFLNSVKCLTRRFSS